MCGFVFVSMFVEFPAVKGWDKEERESGGYCNRELPSGSPFNPQMTYLDSFMFAWRRIKKALHFPFYRLGTHVSTALPESSNLNAFVRGDLVDCSRQRYKLVVSSYNELGEALQFFCSQQSPDYCTVSQRLLLAFQAKHLTLTPLCSGSPIL